MMGSHFLSKVMSQALRRTKRLNQWLNQEQRKVFQNRQLGQGGGRDAMARRSQRSRRNLGSQASQVNRLISPHGGKERPRRGLEENPIPQAHWSIHWRMCHLMSATFRERLTKPSSRARASASSQSPKSRKFHQKNQRRHVSHQSSHPMLQTIWVNPRRPPRNSQWKTHQKKSQCL